MSYEYHHQSPAQQRRTRRWKIRGLLDVLNHPDGVWSDKHTDTLLDLALSSKYNEDNILSKQLQTKRREQTLEREKKHRAEMAALKAEFKQEIARVEHDAVVDRKKLFAELLEAELPQLALQLRTIASLPFMRATSKDGEIDLDKIDRKDAELALKATSVIMKAMGVEGSTRVQATVDRVGEEVIELNEGWVVEEVDG